MASKELINTVPTNEERIEITTSENKSPPPLTKDPLEMSGPVVESNDVAGVSTENSAEQLNVTAEEKKVSKARVCTLYHISANNSD